MISHRLQHSTYIFPFLYLASHLIVSSMRRTWLRFYISLVWHIWSTQFSEWKTSVFSSPQCIDNCSDIQIKLFRILHNPLLLLYKRYVFVDFWGRKVSEIGMNAMISYIYLLLVYLFLCNFSWLNFNTVLQSRRNELYACCEMIVV